MCEFSEKLDPRPPPSTQMPWAERLNLSARQLRAGVDACMRKFVQQHQAVVPDQHRNDAGIGEIAGAENASRLDAFEFGKACFQLRVERMIAGHQPRSS